MIALRARTLHDALSEPEPEAPPVVHDTRLQLEHGFGEQRWRAACACGWLAPVSYGVQTHAASSERWHLGMVRAS